MKDDNGYPIRGLMIRFWSKNLVDTYSFIFVRNYDLKNVTKLSCSKIRIENIFKVIITVDASPRSDESHREIEKRGHCI